MRDFAEDLKELKKKGLLRKLSFIESSCDSHIKIKGKDYINFSSNDYLNLSGHPEIVKTAITALKKYGFGSGSSRLLSGSWLPHKRLEERISAFKKTEAALVFNTGYAANTGIIPAIAGSGDMILSDELNHASIVDGARLSKAEVKIYRHRDMNHLEKLLKTFCLSGKSKGRQCLIVTDAVFSMDGDIAPLKDIVNLAKKYNALLMIDDAHGTGVLGKSGRGGLEHFGLKGENIIQMGTFSKAFGCFGAFAVGSKKLIDLLINRARSFIYSTSLPPSVAEVCVKAIDIVEYESVERRRSLLKNRQRLFEGLNKLGYDTLSSETQIIPMLIGDTENVLRVGNYLFRKKIFAPAIRPPTVPHGKCRIRFSVTAAHTDEDIDRTLESLNKLKI
ncbi:MAG: 8-amino-7-oxononanoate synthase [Nitrospirae bacterium]|nr:8-amino-7-oxononanoate synthase [Nitrospirota bacterium]